MIRPNSIAEWGHLARRFFGSLSAASLAEADCILVAEVLSVQEFELWQRQPLADRRHSVQVARQVESELAKRPARFADDDDVGWVLVAALLHDIGKVESGLGIWGRVAATVVVKVCGRATVRRWSERDSFRGRLGRYLSHPELGAELLRRAQSDRRTIAWVKEHHQNQATWVTPPELARILHQSDND